MFVAFCCSRVGSLFRIQHKTEGGGVVEGGF